MMGQTHSPKPIIIANKKSQVTFFFFSSTNATDAGKKKNQITSIIELTKFSHVNNVITNLESELIVDLALVRTAARAIVGLRRRNAS
jgi:hypothetical protein